MKKKRTSDILNKSTSQAEYRQALLQIQVGVQGRVLQQLSRELHDNIGQLLSVAKLKLNVLEKMDHGTELREHIVQSSEVIEQSLRDIRELIQNLGENFLEDFSFQRNLAHELLQIRKVNKFTTELVVSGTKSVLDHDEEIILFSICQEILTVIVKNSKSAVILVELLYELDTFILCIEFTCVGFNNENVKILGADDDKIQTIHRHAELVGGVAVFKTKSDLTTVVEIKIPADHQEDIDSHET